MGRLYKRENVYWFDFQINGIRYRKSTGKTKRRDAEDIFHAEREKAKSGECVGARKIKDCTVAVLADEYSKWVKFQKSYGSKRFFIKHIVETFGHLRVRDLNARIVEQWQTMRLEHRKPATVNRITSCLRHMVTQGQKWEMVDEETAKRVKSVKLLKEDNKRLRFLTLEECQRLIDCCQEHLKPIVTIALHTGMRRGEILNLKWEHVDLQHYFILLDKTKNGTRREIPINSTLEELFQNLPRGVESNYVFVNKNGKPYRDIKRSFSAALQRAGICDFRFHDCRHTMASHLVMAGIDLTTVKELLGHKDITMTLRYSHLAPGHKRKAVQVLDRIMDKKEEEDYINGTIMAQFQKKPILQKS
jgi:integrase